MKVESLAVNGIACAACVEKVERAVKGVAGVQSIELSMPAATAHVSFDERVTSKALIAGAIEAAGYGVDGSKVQHVHHAKSVCCCADKAAKASREPASARSQTHA